MNQIKSFSGKARNLHSFPWEEQNVQSRHEVIMCSPYALGNRCYWLGQRVMIHRRKKKELKHKLGNWEIDIAYFPFAINSELVGASWNRRLIYQETDQEKTKKKCERTHYLYMRTRRHFKSSYNDNKNSVMYSLIWF